MGQGNSNKVNSIVDKIVEGNNVFKLKSPTEQDKEKDSIAKSINSALSMLNEVGKELVLQDLSVDPDEKFKGFIDNVGNIDISGLIKFTTTIVKAKIEEAEREGIDLKKESTHIFKEKKNLIAEGVLTVAVIDAMVKNYNELTRNEKKALFDNFHMLSPEQRREIERQQNDEFYSKIQELNDMGYNEKAEEWKKKYEKYIIEQDKCAWCKLYTKKILDGLDDAEIKKFEELSKKLEGYGINQDDILRYVSNEFNGNPVNYEKSTAQKENEDIEEITAELELRKLLKRDNSASHIDNVDKLIDYLKSNRQFMVKFVAENFVINSQEELEKFSINSREELEEFINSVHEGKYIRKSFTKGNKGQYISDTSGKNTINYELPPKEMSNISEQLKVNINELTPKFSQKEIGEAQKKLKDYPRKSFVKQNKGQDISDILGEETINYELPPKEMSDVSEQLEININELSKKFSQKEIGEALKKYKTVLEQLPEKYILRLSDNQQNILNTLFIKKGNISPEISSVLSEINYNGQLIDMLRDESKRELFFEQLDKTIEHIQPQPSPTFNQESIRDELAAIPVALSNIEGIDRDDIQAGMQGYKQLLDSIDVSSLQGKSNENVLKILMAKTSEIGLTGNANAILEMMSQIGFSENGDKQIATILTESKEVFTALVDEASKEENIDKVIAENRSQQKISDKEATPGMQALMVDLRVAKQNENHLGNQVVANDESSSGTGDTSASDTTTSQTSSTSKKLTPQNMMNLLIARNTKTSDVLEAQEETKDAVKENDKKEKDNEQKNNDESEIEQ